MFYIIIRTGTITEEEKQAKQLEIQGVQSAEAGDIDGALDFFNRAVVLTPSNASCYNNRAQALRLKGDVAGKSKLVKYNVGPRSVFPNLRI